MAGDRDSTSAWRNAAARRSVVWLVVLTVACLLVGFVWLPSVHADFRADGLWASICRAAGVPASWSGDGGPATVEKRPTTDVVLDRAMARGGTSDAIGRGATLALNCTMCHGARGMSEVVVKQLNDYKSGHRKSSIMEGLAKAMSVRDVDDLGAYYASLPKARTAPTTYGEPLPALVRVGDPMRNIAPCISCHGGVDQKLGAPWIEGMPKDYLVAQMAAFKSGERRNDSEAQMRNMVRAMTAREIDEVAAFYARKATGE